ncbi:MAG: hypothetical protein OZSIB_2480 [Candidatus Ozemobacter sibiricus]|uniref:Type II secretion system protein n=1 Tax=Candidatus Ozemobacter sibiricus TaxID=2268124 RepID=A0A367ZSI1_9BACT|nr:MAG: hypothetical protein OZSIB_2480 [Candidatus Ozemobacter sibiricus]
MRTRGVPHQRARCRPRWSSGWRGLTIIELLVVTTILSLMAALMFPTYRLMQQRDRENRLREILTDVRAARDAYKSYVSRQMWAKIEAANTNQGVRQKAFKQALASASQLGYLYPLNPSSFTNPIHAPGASFTVATDPVTPSDDPAEGVSVSVNRLFLRRIPPHPFTSWSPYARWEFVPAAGGSGRVASEAWTSSMVGVMDIRSVGAGLAIDGTNTDDW